MNLENQVVYITFNHSLSCLFLSLYFFFVLAIHHPLCWFGLLMAWFSHTIPCHNPPPPPVTTHTKKHHSPLTSKLQACREALDSRWGKFQRNATLLKRQLTWQYEFAVFHIPHHILYSAWFSISSFEEYIYMMFEWFRNKPIFFN